MKEAGDKAMSEYKRDNAEKFSKMTKDERAKELKKVRDEAITNKGKELGFTEAKVDQMINKNNKVIYYQIFNNEPHRSFISKIGGQSKELKSNSSKSTTR